LFRCLIIFKLGELKAEIELVFDQIAIIFNLLFLQFTQTFLMTLEVWYFEIVVLIAQIFFFWIGNMNGGLVLFQSVSISVSLVIYILLFLYQIKSLVEYFLFLLYTSNQIFTRYKWLILDSLIFYQIHCFVCL
jgi:hypothetical protein